MTNVAAAPTRTALNVSVLATPQPASNGGTAPSLSLSLPPYAAAAATSPATPVGEDDNTTLASPPQPDANAPQAITAQRVPVRVVIPRAGVNAAVLPLGETDGGAMATPATPTEVGWWQYGVAPGAKGSAVLGGHLDFHDYGAAVFWNLNKLRPGDAISVTDAGGETFRFVVQSSAVYQENDPSAIDRIFRRQDAARLNLITCAGTFNPVTRDYDKRLVVYSVLAQ
jgi:hypothetical protein